MKPEYLKAIENIDADRRRWMKTELMVDLQITGDMAETLIDEYFGKGEPAPTFWISKSRLDRILSKEIDWPHVYTVDQSKHFECVPLFISAKTPAPAPQMEGDPALIGIAEMIEESGGHWRPCSGCYDTEDGHPTQKYDFSPALQTPIGCGCTECGGIGATWEHYTAEEVEQMVRGEVDDEIEILSRLSNGDTVVYSQDGECGWFTKGDRAFVGDAIMALRQKGFLRRQCDDEENYRGMAEYDTISDAGRAHLATATEGQP